MDGGGESNVKHVGNGCPATTLNGLQIFLRMTKLVTTTRSFMPNICSFSLKKGLNFVKTNIGLNYTKSAVSKLFGLGKISQVLNLLTWSP